MRTNENTTFNEAKKEKFNFLILFYNDFLLIELVK